MSEINPLWKFETSPKKKGTCAKCSKTGVFRYYELIATGERLPEKYGKCERENECQHKEVPTIKKLKEDNFMIENNTNVAVITQQKIKIVYPSQSDFNGLNDLSSVFHAYCRKLEITDDHLKKWKVGTGNSGFVQFGYFNRVGAKILP